MALWPGRLPKSRSQSKRGHSCPRRTTPSMKLVGLCIFKPPSKMLWCVISNAAACSESLCSADFSSHQSLHLMPGASVSGCPTPAAAWGHRSLGVLGGGSPISITPQAQGFPHCPELRSPTSHGVIVPFPATPSSPSRPTGACGIFWDNTCTHWETRRIFNLVSDSRTAP